VDGVAHQRRLHERPPLERPRQRVAFKALDARPEADVPGRGVLRLQAADLLDGAWEPEAPPLEQQLPCEQRSVQLASGDDARRDGGTLAPLSSRHRDRASRLQEHRG
jgi:hypothetical protein